MNILQVLLLVNKNVKVQQKIAKTTEN